MSDLASNAAPAPLVHQNYYDEGVRWEQSVYQRTVNSLRVWRGVAVILGLGLLVALAALVLLLPLKTFEVVTLMVDKTTGFVEVARPLEQGGTISQQEAVTRGNIVRFLRARETYDPKGLRDNYELALLYSAGAASRDLQAEFDNSNLRNPMRRYGPDTVVSVMVKSVIFLNERTAAVRFQTTRKNDRETVTEHWVANVRFRYTSEPMRNDWRFDNPLGFQVTEYRKDQETVGATGEAGQ
ncbi:virB8 family protein [Microvirga tunisiensis]|uniref:Type IV secretion system protein virB8 n=1 Tax=Microvirga tunisiensis TaxID=2108360 RepID=A0A5N7MIX2_9HYPH|nr:type IV secretion system protein [Microvirga tunisiensis]MPR08859.1 type VI secretion protein [Microvirga tunisiensis]MPR27042.1 type VI secretion protein [Microvirga tunisiensis]